MNRFSLTLAAALGALALGGCSTSQIPGVFRLDIEQGNVVDQDMLAQLRKGMSRDEVRFIMGTPLLVDPFTDDRWDYVYTFSPEGKRREQRNVTLLFDGDELTKLRGDIARADGPIEVASNAQAEIVVPPGRPRRNRGLLSDWFEDDAIDTAENARREDTPVIDPDAVPVVDDEPTPPRPEQTPEQAQEAAEQAQEEQRERTRVERRQERQEEFYEDLLDEL